MRKENQGEGRMTDLIFLRYKSGLRQGINDYGSERKGCLRPLEGQAGRMNKKGSSSHVGRVLWTEKGRRGRPNAKNVMTGRHGGTPFTRGHHPGMLLPKAHGSKWAPGGKSLLGVSEILQQENRQFQPPRTCFCTRVHVRWDAFLCP